VVIVIKTLAEQANLLTKPELPWQRLRREVEENQMVDIPEDRLRAVEKKLQELEVSLVRQLEALTAAYQHIASALDQLVTKGEFAPIKLIVYGMTACVIAGAVGAVLSRLLPH
jgi:hypothetical protein